MAKTTKEPTREERDVAMISNPDNWPMWPLLPMKKSTSESGQPRELAVLIEDVEGRFRMLHCDMHKFTTGDAVVETVKHTDFPNAAAVVLAGWTVD